MTPTEIRAEIVRVVEQGATHVAARIGGYFEGSIWTSGVWIITIYGREGWRSIDTWRAKAPMHEAAALLAALQHFRVKYRPEIPVLVPDNLMALTEPEAVSP